jgi:energy-coupling factor transport system substrate-specific component
MRARPRLAETTESYVVCDVPVFNDRFLSATANTARHRRRMCAKIMTALLLHAATALSTAAASTKGFTGVRFSLYPKVAGDASLKAAIKTSVAGLKDLGLEVRPDDVSTALLGPEPALFEAMRAAFGRAARLEGEPHVSMVFTFSAGCPGEEEDDAPLPKRTLGAPDEWIADASLLPARVTCQYAIYPLGSADYMGTIREVIALAKRSPAFGAKKRDADGNLMPAGKTHFCTMLDGEGHEVFDVLRSSFARAREHSGHVVMTATITANQKKWKPAPEPQLSRAESPPAADGLPFYDSIDDVLGELDLW